MPPANSKLLSSGNPREACTKRPRPSHPGGKEKFFRPGLVRKRIPSSNKYLGEMKRCRLDTAKAIGSRKKECQTSAAWKREEGNTHRQKGKIVTIVNLWRHRARSGVLPRAPLSGARPPHLQERRNGSSIKNPSGTRPCLQTREAKKA